MGTNIVIENELKHDEKNNFHNHQVLKIKKKDVCSANTTTSRRVCFNPKRTEKPCALVYSVRFGLNHENYKH